MAKITLSLGVRNNNPLNIRYSPSNNWKGQIGSDKGFCKFQNMTFGYRAALILIKKYIKNGRVSIKSIITRWAPPTENDTKSYIRTVIEHFNGYDDTLYKSITADTDITAFESDVTKAIIYELIWIMSLIECGLTKGYDYTDYLRSTTVNKMDHSLNEAFSLYYK